MVEDNNLIQTNNNTSTGNNGVVVLIKKTSDLNGNRDKNNCNEVELNEMRDFEPPDGGTRAWIVVVSAFLCNGIIFGVINSYGIIYKELHDYLVEIGDSEPSRKAGNK